MKNQDRIQQLRTRLLRNEGVDEFEAHTAAGYPVSEIFEAARGTSWRILVANSGRSVSLARVEELLKEWNDGLARLKTATARLRVQDMEHPTLTEQFEQARARTIVARIAEDVSLTGIRAERYLLKGEMSPDVQAGVADILEEVGFEWNGGDTVNEIWTQEYAARYEAAVAKLRRRTENATHLSEVPHVA